MDADRNLLFGVLALQADLLTPAQFAEACSAWAARKGTPLADLRLERAGNPAVWARFLREAQVTGQLEHPGIVPVYEVGQRPDDQAPFYTMRFVRGRTLAEAVE